MDLPELTGLDREVSLKSLVDAADVSGAAETAWAGLAAFAQERTRYALEQRGVPLEIYRGATPPAGDVVPLRARHVADALQRMRASEDFQALAVLFKRVKNIAKELKGPAVLDRAALTEPAERALLAELDARQPRIEQAAAAADYRQAFTEIAGLRPAVDTFFTDVFVMVDDQRLRTARLTLMTDLRNLILHLADISEIVPQTE
jgi:glycyl-tRNA synthetase beta chain